MGNMIMLAKTANPFAEVVRPLVDLIDMAAAPLLTVVTSLGVIYCIFLGMKLAKAEEPQDREKAKGALKNAIVGFLLIFVLIAALKMSVGPLTDWMEGWQKEAQKIESQSD